MSDNNYNFIHREGSAPIKAWTKGVPVEHTAMQLLQNVAAMPFIFKHVAAMPDVHWGMGATVGSVIATKGAIIPAAVGVDIGCGMMALRTDLTANDLPDNLEAVRSTIEAAVPAGRTDNGGANDRGAWHDAPDNVATTWDRIFDKRYDAIADKHPGAKLRRHPATHLATLGTGNHFIEVCLDQEGFVWFMLHSGSRGVGNKIGSYFIEKAKEEMRRWHIDRFLPDQDLAYLPEHTELFDDYVEAVHWAQEYAAANRKLMMGAVIAAVRTVIAKPFNTHDVAINCHHNYVERENHFGANVLVTRKGAVRARAGDLGIIPGSMGTGSFIVRGKGNPDSFCSCSHGAGRKMSRGEAERTFTLEDHAKATAGVECRKDIDVIDETPGAYKDINAVMAAQSDLIDVVFSLKQVVCVKG